jgi:hypothetical protein
VLQDNLIDLFCVIFYLSPLSESARAVASGPAILAEQAGWLPMPEIFKLAVMNFNVHDWNLFNGGP